MLNTKPCRKCGDVLPLDQFYPHKQMADGHLHMCKECSKREAKRHRDENPEQYKSYEQRRLHDTKRKQNVLIGQQKRRAKFPTKYKARRAVKYHLDKGHIQRLPCIKCGNNAEAHHEDYTKPLDITWLCFTHHRERHEELKRLGITIPW